MITVWPVREFLAATSAGFVEGQAVLDLSFAEDSRARVDMNVVMTETGRIVEVQGTAEGLPFTREEMLQLLGLAEAGIRRLITFQKDALADIASVARRLVRGGGYPALAETRAEVAPRPSGTRGRG